jgi:KDO2-lipid IV(A) lauroyltransferase
VADRFVNRLGAKGFVWLQRKLERMTPEQAERFGERLGAIAYQASRKHRELARENVGRAFPELPGAERERIARGVLLHFGRVMGDFMRARVRTNEDVLATVSVEGREHFENARAAGKGAIVVAAHFGNWERMSHAITAMGFPLHVIARDVRDASMNRLVAELRQSSGAQVISRGDAALPTLRALKRNEFVGILPDQNSDELFVPFFGVPCGTVTGPAVLAQRAGCPLLPIYTARIAVNRYRMWIEPPLEPEPGFDPIEGMTRAINRSLENAIRQYPDQYLWIHNRWKSAKRRGLVT